MGQHAVAAQAPDRARQQAHGVPPRTSSTPPAPYFYPPAASSMPDLAQPARLPVAGDLRRVGAVRRHDRRGVHRGQRRHWLGDTDLGVPLRVSTVVPGVLFALHPVSRCPTSTAAGRLGRLVGQRRAERWRWARRPAWAHGASALRHPAWWPSWPSRWRRSPESTTSRCCSARCCLRLLALAILPLLRGARTRPAGATISAR